MYTHSTSRRYNITQQGSVKNGTSHDLSEVEREEYMDQAKLSGYICPFHDFQVQSCVILKSVTFVPKSICFGSETMIL
jgi:hypothetical protein